MKHLGIIVILFIATALRFWQLGSIPPGLHADEALTGYTAYSILKTGKDLVGNQHIVALADVNGDGTFPALYSWLLVPFVAVFGLTTAVDRIPSAVFGVVAVYALYRIVYAFFKRRDIALIASALLAINPGAIHISRQGLLESLSLGMVLLGVMFFITAKDAPRRYIWSGIAWGLALFSYDAPRLFLPLFLPVLIWVQREHVFKFRRQFVAGFAIIAFSYILFIFQLTGRGEAHEYTKSSLLDDGKIVGTVGYGRTMSNAPEWVGKIMHNKATVTVRRIFTNYAYIFSLDWFYINGYGNLQQSVSRYGQFHLFELPFALIGWYMLFRKWQLIGWIAFVWLAVGTLPGGLSSANSVYRNSLIIPAPIIASALGMWYAFSWMKHVKPMVRIALFVVGLAIAGYGAASYFVTYFYEYPVYASEAWSRQQNESIRYGASQKDAYDYVFFDGGRPWLLQHAFQTGMDPDVFRDVSAKLVEESGRKYYRSGNLYFGELNDTIRLQPTTADYFPKNSLVITLGAEDVFATDTPVMRFPAPDGRRSTYKAIEVY